VETPNIMRLPSMPRSSIDPRRNARVEISYKRISGLPRAFEAQSRPGKHALRKVGEQARRRLVGGLRRHAMTETLRDAALQLARYEVAVFSHL